MLKIKQKKKSKTNPMKTRRKKLDWYTYVEQNPKKNIKL